MANHYNFLSVLVNLRRQAERPQIEGDPARANGIGSPTATITDDELIGIAREVGPDRMLSAAAIVESRRIAR